MCNNIIVVILYIVFIVVSTTRVLNVQCERNNISVYMYTYINITFFVM